MSNVIMASLSRVYQVWPTLQLSMIVKSPHVWHAGGLVCYDYYRYRIKYSDDINFVCVEITSNKQIMITGINAY